MMSVSATSSKTDSLARIGGEEGVKEVFTINDDAGNQYKQADNVDLLNGAKRLKSAAKTSTPTKARGATYDGNVCLICGDKASGLHYGVLACEGCKGFFKRVCKEKLVCPPPQPDDGDASQKRQCLFGGNCEINMRTRNRCQYCRIQKCVELGMSKDGIKLGRRSKHFKQNLDNHQQASNKLFDSKNGLATSGLNLLAGASPAMPQEPGKQLIGIIQDNALIFKTVDVISTTSAVKLEHGLALKSDLTQQPSLSNAAQSVLPTGHNGSLMPTLILNNTPSAILMINAPQSTTSQTKSSKDSNQSSPYPILIYQQQPSTSSSLSQPQVATSSSSSAQPLTTANPSPTTTDSGGSVSESTSIYSMLNESEISNIVQATYQAYKETAFDYQSDGESAETPIEQLIEAQGHEALKYLFSKGVIEFLRGSKFLDHFNILIENAVLFAKNTPYFMNINETDRITLLKSCVFQVICVRHANYFYSSSSSSNQSALNQKPMPSQEEIVELATYALITPASHTDRFLIPIYNSYVTRAWFAQHLPRLSTLINLLFDFYRHFQLYELTDTERSLFCAYLLFNTDNSTLVDFSDLNNYRELFGDIFLNTLVNKLTSSKQTTISSRQIRAWMSESYAKLKQIDVEHAKLLNEYKPFIVWPDLYSELYNL